MLKKAKRKYINYKHPLALISAVSTFTIISSYSLEDCVIYLKKQATDSGKFKSSTYPTIRVAVQAIDSNRYVFQLKKEEYLEANLFTSGYMELFSESSTLISGTVGVPGFSVLPLIIFLLLLVFLWPIAILLAIWAILRRYSYNNAFVEYLKTILKAEDRK